MRAPSRRRPRARTSAPRASWLETASLALVFLVPVFFWRGTQEIFEVPKVGLLVTGALALAAYGAAVLLSGLARRGAGAVLAGSGGPIHLLRRDPLGCAVALYLLSCAVSTALSPNPSQSFFGAPESTAGLRTALATAAVFYASRSLRGTAARFERLALAAAAAALVAALYGALQAAGADPLTWGRTASYGAALRVFGTLGHPNFLGASLAMSLPLMLHCRRRVGSGPAALAWTAGSFLTLAVLAATLSRAAWLGFAAAALAWPFLERAARGEDEAASARPFLRPSWGIAGLATLGIVAAAIAVPSPLGHALRARLGDLFNPHAATNETRLQIWAAGLRMAQDHPLAGVGLDAFGTWFPKYRTAAYWRLEWGATPAKAHNEAVEILATQGILGAAAALLVVIAVLVLLRRALRSRDGAVRRAGAVLGASFLAFGVQDLASFTVVGIGVPVAALAGWLAAAGEEDIRGAPGGRPSARPLAWSVAVGILLAAAAFVPLAVRPWGAEAAARRAATLPERSDLQASAIEDAARQAPWDARYPARLAFLRYRRAQDEADSTVRRALLARARASSERATALEPQSGMYLTNLGEIEVEQSLLRPPDCAAPQADATLRRAIAADTANGQTLDRIGFALARLGRRGEARRVALRLAGLYPDLGPPLGLVGLMALDERRTADGLDTLRLALARDWRDQTAPHASAWNNLAVGYLAARRYAEARDAAREALRLDPSLGSARHNLLLAEGVLRTIGAAGR